MNKRNDLIVEWAVNRIEREYKDDVCLLLTYGSYENGTANPMSDVDFYFIPKTDRSYELCKTFIIEGIGFDLFPMSWQRVEGLAELNECLTPCLANVKILYCNSEEDKKRFEGLQNRLRENLNNKAFMLDKSSKMIEKSVNLYGAMMFQEDICQLRVAAGYIAMFLSDAVAYANQTYFKRGLKKQIEDLKEMEGIPEDFIQLYESIVKASSGREIKEFCHRMIKNTKGFLSNRAEKSKDKEKKADYKGLAELYQEIVSTWNKIYVCCDSGNAVLAYISGTCLQETLNEAAEENGIGKLDLMGAYDAENLEQFRERAMEVQKQFVKMIQDNGVAIETYDNVEEFLKNN